MFDNFSGKVKRIFDCVFFLLVNGSKISTKYFASLHVGARKADKIDLKGGQPSTPFLCTLQEFPQVSDVFLFLQT